MRPQLLEQLRPDAANVDQIIDAAKRAVGSPVRDDAAGEHRPNARQRLQLPCRSAVNRHDDWLRRGLTTVRGRDLLTFARHVHLLAVGQHGGEVQLIAIGLGSGAARGEQRLVDARPVGQFINAWLHDGPGYMYDNTREGCMNRLPIGLTIRHACRQSSRPGPLSGGFATGMIRSGQYWRLRGYRVREAPPMPEKPACQDEHYRGTNSDEKTVAAQSPSLPPEHSPPFIQFLPECAGRGQPLTPFLPHRHNGEEQERDHLYRKLKRLLFRLDPERAHHVAAAALRTAQSTPGALAVLGRRYTSDDPGLVQQLWGLRFPGPVGLAAGFDKDGIAVRALAALGFGSIEIGTVTPRPQPGNPRPRLFRLTADEALINRMGFNNGGATAMAARLAAGRPAVPLGINLGKNKDTPNDQAATDYVTGLERLYAFGDYFVVNVSSPNTPGLRELQGRDFLADLLGQLQEKNRALASDHGLTRPRPLLLKLAPDLTPAALAEAVDVALGAGLDGLIATNTTISRDGLATPPPLCDEAGGLSGRPLRERAAMVLAAVYRQAGGKMPLIGVGGIMNADDAYSRIRAGASLLQVYTGFIYNGPSFVRSLHDGLAARLRRDGFAHLSDAVGVDASAYPAEW